jgi:hypothetical protein
MGLVRDTIANFIGGVSQQPDKVIFPNQSKVLKNYLPTPADGLLKRPPLEHVSYLRTALDHYPYCHTTIKEDEEYEIIVDGTGNIQVWDLEGHSKNVNIEVEGEVDEALISTTQSHRPAKLKEATFAKTTKNVDKWRKITIDEVDYWYWYNHTTGVIGNIYKDHSDTTQESGTDLFGYSETSYKPYTKKKYYIELCYLNDTIVTENTDTQERKTFYCEYPLSVGSQIYNNAALSDDAGKVTALDTTNNIITRTGIIKEPLTVDAPVTNYIKTTDPLKDLFIITIGDYNFILNKTVKTELADDLYINPYQASALLFVKQGDYKTDHKVKINGNTVADYTTSNEPDTTKTNHIREELYTDLTTNLDSNDWDVSFYGSVICIKKKDGTDFTITTEDSNANRNLLLFYKSADTVSDLPLEAPNGFILKIRGEGQNKSDDYYVKFETATGIEFGQGSWKECTAPNEKYKINPATMPHALVRDSNGQFTFKLLKWTERKAGDNDTNPKPSFIDNPIREIFTHKGRLAFLAEDKVIFSDTSDIFSFFKKTTLTELDSDPIDVGSNSQMVLLKHSLPFNEELLLFSEDAAFTVKGGDVFSNKTVSMDMTMGYQVSKSCKPVSLGATGLFLYENGKYSHVMEIYITSTYTIDAREVTAQVPSYIPSGVFKITKSTANNFAALMTTEAEDKLYCYNFYYDSEKKQQSAWHMWQFDNARILNADFKENWLYVVLQYADGIYLNKINFTAKNKENNLDYIFCLDRKLYYSGNYISKDTTNNTTTFILPYTPQDTLTVLDNRGFPQEFTQDNRTITVEGLFDELITGFIYNSLWQLPKIYVREQSTNGALKVKEGILMLRDLNLAYTNTGYFTVTVTPKYTTNITSTFEFTGKITGLANTQLEQIPVSDGAFLIPIIANNEEITVEIEDDNYLPCCFLSLEWLGEFTVRGQ